MYINQIRTDRIHHEETNARGILHCSLRSNEKTPMEWNVVGS